MDAPTIITRAEAKARGLKRYYTGVPCLHGHVCERYTVHKSCVACAVERAARWSKENPDRQAASQRRWTERNRDVIREKQKVRSRIGYWADPDAARTRDKQCKDRNREKIRAQERFRRLNRSEEQRRQDREYERAYRERNKAVIRERMQAWRKANRESISQSNHEWRADNKERVKQRHDEWHARNAARVKVVRQQYRERHWAKYHERAKRWARERDVMIAVLSSPDLRWIRPEDTAETKRQILSQAMKLGVIKKEDVQWLLT